MSGKRRGHIPLRTCIACQRKRPKRELIRVVRVPEGTIEVDPRGKRSGRGAYLCANGRCLEMALERSKLGRALKCQVSTEEVAELRAQAAPLMLDRTDGVSEMPWVETEQVGRASERLDVDLPLKGD